jgi:hypothetical protein
MVIAGDPEPTKQLPGHRLRQVVQQDNRNNVRLLERIPVNNGVQRRQGILQRFLLK